MTTPPASRDRNDFPFRPLRAFSFRVPAGFVLSLAWACAGWAAEPGGPADSEIVTLDSMQVTSVTGNAKAIDRIPGAINLISSDDISHQLLISQDPTTILANTIPGYAPSRQSLNMGGETLRGRQALFLLDGIPQSTPLREGNREGYFADQSVIARIEVINGPSATEGLGASGGVINFITKVPTKMGNQATLDGSVTSGLQSYSLGWRADATFAHKDQSYDLFFSLATVTRAVDHDAHDRLLGMDINGSAQDSNSHSFFLKLGHNFGANGSQRIEATFNRFDINANGNYHELDGNRLIGLPTTAARGAPPGRPPSNTMQAMMLKWSDANFAGGTLSAQGYKDKENIVFGAQNVASFQDPLIAPLGTFYDQSATTAAKYGSRVLWDRPNLIWTGVELTVGYDYLHDETRQDLLLTTRTFVPNMKFSSNSFFEQLEYEYGPVTVRGGAREETADLTVDTYQGRYAVNRVVVQGGTLSYRQVIPNVGAIYRLPLGFSLDLAYSEGYSIPDVGTVLRNINTPNQSVANIAELTPILADNLEGGLTWRGSKGSIGGSYYKSTSKYGAQTVLVGGITQLIRLPVEITGMEATAEYKPVKTITFNAIFSHIHGKTAAANGGPLDLDLSAINQGPTKLAGSVDWAYAPKGSIQLGGQKYFPRSINLGRTGFEEHFSGFTLFEFSTTYQTKCGRLGLGVENLFNKYYVNYVSEAAVGQQTNASYFAGRGRTFTLSDSLSF